MLKKTVALILALIMMIPFNVLAYSNSTKTGMKNKNRAEYFLDEFDGDEWNRDGWEIVSTNSENTWGFYFMDGETHFDRVIAIKPDYENEQNETILSPLFSLKDAKKAYVSFALAVDDVTNANYSLALVMVGADGEQSVVSNIECGKENSMFIEVDVPVSEKYFEDNVRFGFVYSGKGGASVAIDSVRVGTLLGEEEPTEERVLEIDYNKIMYQSEMTDAQVQAMYYLYQKEILFAEVDDSTNEGFIFSNGKMVILSNTKTGEIFLLAHVYENDTVYAKIDHSELEGKAAEALKDYDSVLVIFGEETPEDKYQDIDMDFIYPELHISFANQIAIQVMLERGAIKSENVSQRTGMPLDIRSNDGKLLFTFDEATYTYHIADGVTSEDSFSYAITEEDRQLVLHDTGMNVLAGYSNVNITFHDETKAQTRIVIDATKQRDYIDMQQSTVLDMLMMTNGIQGELGLTMSIFHDAKGRRAFRYYNSTSEISVYDNFTYLDNMHIEITEDILNVASEIDEKYAEMFKDIEYVDIIFGEEPPKQEHTITINGGTSDYDSAVEDTKITIKANEPEQGKVFDKWVVEEGLVSISNVYSEETYFIMGDADVVITATYKDDETPIEEPYKLGDADLNSVIEAADATVVLRYVAKLDELSGTQLKASDINEDNIVDSADATKILRVVAGLE